jgi:hypothetical protein
MRVPRWVWIRGSSVSRWHRTPLTLFCRFSPMPPATNNVIRSCRKCFASSPNLRSLVANAILTHAKSGAAPPPSPPVNQHLKSTPLINTKAWLSGITPLGVPCSPPVNTLRSQQANSHPTNSLGLNHPLDDPTEVITCNRKETQAAWAIESRCRGKKKPTRCPRFPENPSRE